MMDPSRRGDAVRDEFALQLELLDTLPIGVLHVGADWRVRHVNELAAALLAIPRDRLLGGVLGEFPFAHPAARMATYREVMASRRPRALRDLRARSADYPDRVFDAEVHPGPAGGIVIVFLSVGERARLERDLEASGDELRRQVEATVAARRDAATASEAKGEFLAVMSHEIRTPLNAILGYTELMETSLAGPLTELQRSYLERVRVSGKHLLGLVNELLDLGRLESGKLTVAHERARASDAVAAALALMRPLAAARGLTLVEHCDYAHPVHYDGDEDRVRQCVLNLLSNAVKFTEPRGRITVTCGRADGVAEDVELAGPGPWAFIRVVDTGIGIAPEQLESIFEPFVQAERGRTRTRDGTGLGLAISRRLARLMGGDISVTSRVGMGSTFTLWLPAPLEVHEPLGAPPTAPHDLYATHGLVELGELLAREVDAVVAALVEALRRDPLTPFARDCTDSQLEDHTAAFLADVAQSLRILADSPGDPSLTMRDGTEIERVIAERHGIQRFRLGCSEEGIQREYAILGEQIDALVARSGIAVTADAHRVLAQLLDYAERTTLRAYRIAADSREN